VKVKKSWKTSAAGIAAIVISIASIAQAQFDADPLTVPNYEIAIAAIMSGLVGLFARDNDVSSEQAGVKDEG